MINIKYERHFYSSVIFPEMSLYILRFKKKDIFVFSSPFWRLKKDGKVKIKGNVDAELVLHAMIEYKSYDKAVIVSGDGDFYCLLEYLAQQNKLLKVIVPNSRYSSLLRKFSKFIVNINLLRGKLEFRNKK